MKILHRIKNIIDQFKKVHFSNRCAAISFFVMIAFFSISVILVLLIKIIPSLSTIIYEYIHTLFPRPIAEYILSLFSEISLPSGYISLILALLSCIWSASKAIKALIIGFDSTYYYDSNRHKQSHAFSLLATIVVGISLIIVFALSLAIDPIVDGLFGLEIRDILTNVFTISMLTILLTGIYHFLSSINTRFRSIILGALIAAILLLLLSKTFSLYLSYFTSFPSLLGSFGLIFIFLIWLYYNSFIILLGCFINSYINNVNNLSTKSLDKQR